MANWMAFMGWQGWVILSGLLSGVAQGIGKRQVAHMSSFQSGVLRDGTILMIVGIMFLWQGGGVWSTLNWIWLGVGVLESVMMAAYYSASRDELASTVIFSYPLSSVLIVGAAGVLFGEWQYFDPRTSVGLLNIVSLVAVIALMLAYQGGKLRGTRWSTKIVLSSLMIVVSNVVIKWAVSVMGVAPSNYLVYEYLGLLMGGLAYVVIRRQGMRVGWRQVGWGALQGSLFALSVLLITEIIKIYPLSLAITMRRVATIATTVLMGLWFYKEARGMSKTQKIYLVTAVVILAVMMWVN